MMPRNNPNRPHREPACASRHGHMHFGRRDRLGQTCPRRSTRIRAARGWGTFAVSALVLAATALEALPVAASPSAGRPGGIDVRVFRFVDRTRTIGLPDGTRVDRTVATIVRYPSTGGPYPLVVFGHGFALTPANYATLLRAWTTAGYVVAAPVFPLGNANAPGGPNESDLVNQPADMRLVITRLLALDTRTGRVLHGRIDPRRIAVAGHSDGAVTALAVAYDSRYRDPRVGAAVILSGAEMSGMSAFPRNGPPLLAMQGTVDPTNAPGNTLAYYARAARPKFLVLLIGASHRPPYTTQEPQLRVVERVTIAFLDHYLKHAPLRPLVLAARNPGVSTLEADP
jgi:dienelactone hydrolase